jgi:hypothetical protein
METVTSAVSLKTVEIRANRDGSETRPYTKSHTAVANLRGFAWALAFQGLFAANVDLDLLGLGFCLLRQADL